MRAHEYPKFQPRPFYIVVRIDGRDRRLKVLQTLEGIGEAHYQITASNKTLVFSTNKPIIDRRGLKDFPWTWKLIQGELHNARAHDAIIESLESYLRGKQRPGGELRRV